MKEEVIRLLVVDGTPGDCDQLALLIKNEGMTHSVAHNAKTALDRIRLTSQICWSPISGFQIWMA